MNVHSIDKPYATVPTTATYRKYHHRRYYTFDGIEYVEVKGRVESNTMYFRRSEKCDYFAQLHLPRNFDNHMVKWSILVWEDGRTKLLGKMPKETFKLDLARGMERLAEEYYFEKARMEAVMEKHKRIIAKVKGDE